MPVNDNIPVAPLDSSASTNTNVHRLVQISPTKLALEPGNIPLIWMAIFTLFAAIALSVALLKRLSIEITAAIAGAPLFAAIGFGIVGYTYRRHGTRVTFDKANGEIRITGARHNPERRLSFSQISAVQFLDAGIKGDEGSWHAFQVNLVTATLPVERINLLDAAGEESLRSTAHQIATFLGVPLFIGDRRAD